MRVSDNPERHRRVVVFHPHLHSLRVHFATSLYRQGFPLDFIESIMSHTPQSNTYDSYYDVDDEEFRKAQQSKYRKSYSSTLQQNFIT